jgi:hypothetical protein
MDKINIFLTKYGLYILVSGIVLLIIGTTWMNNLPSPYYLAPGEATTRYYVPLRIARFLKTIGIIGLLVGAFMTIRNFMAIKNSAAIDTDKITKAIADAITRPQNQSNVQGSSGPFVAAGGASTGRPTPRSSVVEVRKTLTPAGYEYVYVDENNTQVVGINSILNHLISKGYRIVNTLETNSAERAVLQIIVEK